MIKRTISLTFAALLACAGLATAAGAQIVFQGASGGARARPANLFLSADGTLEVSSVHWSSWGGGTATGTGEAEYHGCNPVCGAAPIHHAFVHIKLTKPIRCGSSGITYYDRVSLMLSPGKFLDSGYLLEQDWAPCLAP